MLIKIGKDKNLNLLDGNYFNNIQTFSYVQSFTHLISMYIQKASCIS